MRRRISPAFITSILLGGAACLSALPGASQQPQPEPERQTPSAPRTALEKFPTRAWQAKWIWTPGDPGPRNSYTYFRKLIELDGAQREAKLHITADSRYQLFVNGELAGRGPVRSDRRFLYYDTWDVGSRLKRGKNVLAVIVHHYGEFTFQYMKGRGGLLAELVSGSGRALAKTDSTWHAQRSEAWRTGQPRMSIQLGFNEDYDFRKEPKDWKEPRFDDTAWPAAVEIGPAGMEPWPHLTARDIPAMAEEPHPAVKVLEIAEVEDGAPPQAGSPPPPKLVSEQMNVGRRAPARAVSVRSPEKLLIPEATGTIVRTAPGLRASLLIDFGKEVTGYPGLKVRGAKGGEVIDLGYGEVLQDDKGGFIAQSSDKLGRLNPNRDDVHYADRFTCRPGAQEIRTFDKRAFRYMLLDMRNAPEGIEISDLDILFSTYPVEYKGSFQCSDERLNRIWEIGRYTCQLNMEDGYTDCPWRERGQWWGDARVEALINYYCFGDTKLMKKALRQKGQSLNDEGMTWGVYPTDWDGGRLPSFTLIWMSCVWETYLYTGDESVVKELFPKVRKSLDTFFAPKVGPRGLLKDVPYWVFIDWAPVDDKGEPGALNAYYYDALRSAAAMARLLGDPSAAEYERRAESVKAAMNSQLWDAAAHAYRDSIQPDGKLAAKISQQTNSLCVLFDIAPAVEQTKILDAIYSPSSKGKVVEAGSPYFSYYQLAALYHAGRHEQALQYIRQKWGVMLDWGATTWWEMWNPGASFCHGWSGGPTYNLPSEVLGIKPLKPGFAEVDIRPQWVGLQYAAGAIPTAKGMVKVAWQHDAAGRTAAVRVETPAGVPAEITLPGTGDVMVNKKASPGSGVTALKSEAGTTRYRLEKGGKLLLELKER